MKQRREAERGGGASGARGLHEERERERERERDVLKERETYKERERERDVLR